MMKLSWKSCVRIGVSAFLLYLAIHYWSAVSGFVGLVFSAAMPLVIGGVFAFILNILMTFYERHYFPRKKNKAIEKSRRPVCLLLALLTLLAIIAFVIILVVPEFISSIQLLLSEIPAALERAIAYLDTLGWLPDTTKETLHNTDWQSGISQLLKVLTTGVGNVVGFVAGTVTSVVSVIITGFLSIIFTLYLLGGKEQIGGQVMRVMRIYLPKKWFRRITHVLAVLSDSFHRYIVGQCLEAVILGTLCAVGMMIFRFPYATMIGALVAFTALIPIAGAYIGAFVGAFMILTISPIKALLFLVYLVILQQLEGNLIYPRVVGSSLGLPGIWVLAAVTIGGSLMGIFGMLLGVPLAAAAYRLLREDVVRREADMPEQTP